MIRKPSMTHTHIDLWNDTNNHQGWTVHCSMSNDLQMSKEICSSQEQFHGKNTFTSRIITGHTHNLSRMTSLFPPAITRQSLLMYLDSVLLGIHYNWPKCPLGKQTHSTWETCHPRLRYTIYPRLQRTEQILPLTKLLSQQMLLLCLFQRKPCPIKLLYPVAIHARLLFHELRVSSPKTKAQSSSSVRVSSSPPMPRKTPAFDEKQRDFGYRAILENPKIHLKSESCAQNILNISKDRIPCSPLGL